MIEEEQQFKDPESAVEKVKSVVYINGEVPHEEDDDPTPGFCEALGMFDRTYLVLHAIQFFAAGMVSMTVLGFTYLCKENYHLDPSAT